MYHRKELRRKAFWDTRTDTQAVDRPGPAPDVRAGPTSYIDTGEHVVGLQQIQAAVFPYQVSDTDNVASSVQPLAED